MREITILVVGESSQAGALMQSCPAVCRCEAVEDVAAAVERLAQSEFDLVALCCSRRREFNSANVRALQQAAPLARIVAVTGSLCAGPWRRSADLLDGASIIPSHRWPGWLLASGDRLRSKLPALWSFPATMGNEEWAGFGSSQTVNAQGGLITIHSSSRDAAEAISDVLSAAGYVTAWQRDEVESVTRGAIASIVDADAWNDDVADRMSSLRAQHPITPILLLLNFPLAEDLNAARVTGVSAVVAKPLSHSEFLAQLRHCVGERKIHRSGAA